MIGCSGLGNENLNPARLLPSGPPNWRHLEDLSFTGISLSDYINGGAEAYFAYGFEQVAVRKFQNNSDMRLTVEVYEMDKAEDAFGAYSSDSSGERWDIGEDSSFSHGLLRFWKGPYFVRILCFPYDSSSEAIIREIGAKIAGSITAESRRPDMLEILPAENIMPDSVCYFHRQTSLNNIRFISDENPLDLGDDTEALTWEQYVRSPNADNGRLRQIVIKYPSSSAAEAAFRKFEVNILNGAPEHTDGKDCARAGRSGMWLCIVLDAPSCEAAEGALAQTLNTLARQS